MGNGLLFKWEDSKAVKYATPRSVYVSLVVILSCCDYGAQNQAPC